MAVCERHPSEVADTTCRHCRGPFCSRCLVFPFGPGKPALCVACALAAGGVRSSAARAPRPKAPRSRWRRHQPEPVAPPQDDTFVPLQF
jgi:hypothetical protein